jgi:hypothetical protein
MIPGIPRVKLLYELKQNITADSLKNIVKAAGVAPDEVRVKAHTVALSTLKRRLKGFPHCSARTSLSLHFFIFFNLRALRVLSIF